MSVATNTAELVVGSRVDLDVSGELHDPGTIVGWEDGKRIAKVVWDSNTAMGGAWQRDNASASSHTTIGLRALTLEEMTKFPMPPLIKSHLATLNVPEAPTMTTVPIATIDKLNEDLAQSRRVVHRLEQEMIRFKERVVNAAVEGADEHGWCSEIREIIEGLGMDWPSRVRTANFEVLVRVCVSGDITDEDQTVDEDFVNSSLHLGSDGEVSMDGDWDDVEITSTEIVSVESLEVERKS